MATLTLDATVAGPNSNSYCTLASCQHILAENIHIYSTFASLSTANAEACLIYATHILDEKCDWVGNRGSTTQALRWPRNDVYDTDGEAIDTNTIPEFLRRAVSFFGYYLSQSNRISEADTLGFSRLDAGSLRMDIDKYDRQKTIPNPVWDIVKPYCTSTESRGRTLVRK